MPLPPTVATMFAQVVALGRPAFSAGIPAEAGYGMAAAGRAALGRGPEVHAFEEAAGPTRSGSVPARVCRPKPSPDGVGVDLHGGEWALGAPDDLDAVARALTARSGGTIVLPDARLAPEAPCPGALGDGTVVMADAALGEIAVAGAVGAARAGDREEAAS